MEKLATELSKTTTWIGTGRARSNKGSTRRHIGTGLLGLGALGVGMAVLYGLDAKHTQQTIESTSAWGPEFEQLMAHGETANQRAMVLSAAGGALLIGGAVLYYLGERASKDVEVENELPSDTTNTTALRVGGRF